MNLLLANRWILESPCENYKVYRYVTSYSVLNVYRRFGGSYGLDLIQRVEK
jgi:hypothetical protein